VNSKLPTNNMINIYHQNICTSMSAALTPKSLIDFVNNATQDDKQHNTAFRRWNHKKNTKKNYICKSLI